MVVLVETAKLFDIDLFHLRDVVGAISIDECSDDIALFATGDRVRKYVAVCGRPNVHVVAEVHAGFGHSGVYFLVREYAAVCGYFRRCLWHDVGE